MPRHPLTAAHSPFVDGSLLARNGAVPESEPVANPAAEIYVDPNGDDGASGTKTEPVATLERAQDLARAALSENTGDVVVYLRGGVHPRSEPLELTFQDSGRSGSRMIYRSYPNEQAILEGGLQVTDWEAAFDAVLVADVPSGAQEVRQFFAGGIRQPRARSTNADYTALEFLKGPLFNAQRNVAMTVDADVIAEFARPENLELVYVGVAIAGHGLFRSNGLERPRPSWKAHRLPVTAATVQGDGTARLDIGNGALYHASQRGYGPLEIQPADPFFLENAIELLDEPGEWYFDDVAMKLYWWPPSMEATGDAWVAVTETLLEIDGTPDRTVRNVSIEGIAFRHAGYTEPSDSGYVVSQAASWFTGWREADWMESEGQRHSYLDAVRRPRQPGAAVLIDSARDITFSRDVFAELGAAGVLVQNDVKRITFDSSVFVDISAAALVAGHPVHDEIDEPMEGPISDLRFTNNVVERAAAEFYASVGVQITKADSVEISNNLFHDLPYSALSLGWGWEDNPNSTTHRAIEVSNNYFENVVNLLYDGAPIYLLGPVAEVGAPRRDFVQIRGNFVSNLGANPQFKAPSDPVDPDFAKRPGIQIDKGSRNVLAVDNVFTGTTRWLQVTAWQSHRADARWADELALIARRNWSDTAASEPTDLRLLNASEAELFDPESVPLEVEELIAAAGLEPGVELPPLP